MKIEPSVDDMLDEWANRPDIRTKLARGYKLNSPDIDALIDAACSRIQERVRANAVEDRLTDAFLGHGPRGAAWKADR